MLFLWTFNYIIGKISLRRIDPISLAVFRFELAAIVMLAIYFARRRERTPLRRADLGRVAVLGILGVLLNQGGFTIGLNFTSSDHSAVIAAVAPVMVLLFASMLGLEGLTAAKDNRHGHFVRRRARTGNRARLSLAFAVSQG